MQRVLLCLDQALGRLRNLFFSFSFFFGVAGRSCVPPSVLFFSPLLFIDFFFRAIAVVGRRAQGSAGDGCF